MVTIQKGFSAVRNAFMMINDCRLVLIILSVARYEEDRQENMKTLTSNRKHHQKADVDKLYLLR